MNSLVQTVESTETLLCTARRLRQVALERELAPHKVLEIFERWSAALADREVQNIPGVAFLRLWLRRGNLEPILLRELGPGALHGAWRDEGRAKLRSLPLGVVGHWPAGNIEIQPLLSMSCGLLGGNACLVRIPVALVEITALLLSRLQAADESSTLLDRISFASFDHSRRDLQEAMASAVDGAMIWGGAEAVAQIRSLPFPHWARIAVFGPRISAAAMDAATWSDRDKRASWCRRIARDVWQFDQQACSSPQTLFLEKSQGCDPLEFMHELQQAFEEENRQHSRAEIEPALTSSICAARAMWLLADESHRAFFPNTPDWTLLFGDGAEMPDPTQGRTLTVLAVDDLMDAVARFDGSLQTLGLGISDPAREEVLAEAAGRRGVDRVVKLGRMHVFGSPWDGTDLIRPMVRSMRHVPSQD